MTTSNIDLIMKFNTVQERARSCGLHISIEEDPKFDTPKYRYYFVISVDRDSIKGKYKTRNIECLNAFIDGFSLRGVVDNDKN